MQWPSLIVQRVIIHDVPSPTARSTEAADPILSECESPSNTEVTTHMREKIVLGVKSRNTISAIVDPSTTSPVPDLVRSVFESPEQFVPSSQRMAQHLHQIQNAVNSPGLLAIADCSLAGGRALAVMKLERDTGARINQRTVEGQRTFGIEVLHDLLLTQATRLFKIGVFLKDNGNNIQRVHVFDGQTPYMEQSKVARFFLCAFLGCCLAEDPEVTTQKFFVASQEYFNDHVSDGTTQVQYTEHLLSELTNELPAVSPRQFAERCLHTEDREQYITYLQEHDVSDAQFPKNTKFIQNRLAKLQVEFEHGIKIVGTRDALDGNVQWTDMPNGNTKAEVTGRLKEVRGA
ncbi:nucleoid-associated protein [Dehalococcoides mccartyi]|uniref:nucleoid-associated protein n=1 Tax=Dehalococcoides mccartyi TaxID=61435 RepID=UPI00398B22CC